MKEVSLKLKGRIFRKVEVLDLVFFFFGLLLRYLALSLCGSCAYGIKSVSAVFVIQLLSLPAIHHLSRFANLSYD